MSDKNFDSAGLDRLLAPVREMIRTCMQCGTCTGSCPNEFAMDFSPRRLWRLLAAGEVNEIFASQTFALCSSCYYCTLRCPRGLPLTTVMAALKRIAARVRPRSVQPGHDFYRHFLASVRRRGRVNEMEAMTRYFLSRMNPWLPLRFMPLGLRLMGKGKVAFPIGPGSGQADRLDPLFRKVEEMEKGQ